MNKSLEDHHFNLSLVVGDDCNDNKTECSSLFSNSTSQRSLLSVPSFFDLQGIEEGEEDGDCDGEEQATCAPIKKEDSTLAHGEQDKTSRTTCKVLDRRVQSLRRRQDKTKISTAPASPLSPRKRALLIPLPHIERSTNSNLSLNNIARIDKAPTCPRRVCSYWIRGEIEGTKCFWLLYLYMHHHVQGSMAILWVGPTNVSATRATIYRTFVNMRTTTSWASKSVTFSPYPKHCWMPPLLTRTSNTYVEPHSWTNDSIPPTCHSTSEIPKTRGIATVSAQLICTLPQQDDMAQKMYANRERKTARCSTRKVEKQ